MNTNFIIKNCITAYAITIPVMTTFLFAGIYKLSNIFFKINAIFVPDAYINRPQLKKEMFIEHSITHTT
jgi:hypothetical protein